MSAPEMSCAKGNCECPTLLREIIRDQKDLAKRVDALNALVIKLSALKTLKPRSPSQLETPSTGASAHVRTALSTSEL
jgi:hypothetical protein